MKNKKPKLSIDEQVNYLNDKGITFDKVSQEEAKEYLRNNNNYFKLTSYRKNFYKHPEGVNKGKYIDLDFAYLQDLAIVDMRLRYTLVHISLDIEHFTKIAIIKKVEETDEDGYSIVKDYIDSLGEKQKPVFESEINRNKGNIYCGSIVSKYENNYPIWAFVEIIPFGRLVSFYGFCAERFEDDYMKDNYFRLLTCKEIRNACAHSNCILNELSMNTAKHRTNNKVTEEIMKIDIVSSNTRKKRMSNAHVQQIVTLLYMHKTMVTSEGVHEHVASVLNITMKRIFKNIEYYTGNETITSTFEFLKIVVDNWFGIEYSTDT